MLKNYTFFQMLGTTAFSPRHFKSNTSFIIFIHIKMEWFYIKYPCVWWRYSGWCTTKNCYLPKWLFFVRQIHIELQAFCAKKHNVVGTAAVLCFFCYTQSKNNPKSVSKIEKNIYLIDFICRVVRKF